MKNFLFETHDENSVKLLFIRRVLKNIEKFQHRKMKLKEPKILANLIEEKNRLKQMKMDLMDKLEENHIKNLFAEIENFHKKESKKDERKYSDFESISKIIS